MPAYKYASLQQHHRERENKLNPADIRILKFHEQTHTRMYENGGYEYEKIIVSKFIGKARRVSLIRKNVPDRWQSRYTVIFFSADYERFSPTLSE